MNLIPNEPSSTPNYWCTWNTQNYSASINSIEQMKGNEGASIARNNLNEEVLFTNPGWIAKYFDKIRKDLYVVLDDGWDVPYNTSRKEEFGSLSLERERFASFDGNQQERLKKINERIKSLGWRGTGIWVAAQATGEKEAKNQLSANGYQDYWRERVKWCKYAGVEYWKVDWGLHGDSLEFRNTLTRIGKEISENLKIEHSACIPPLNGISCRTYRYNDCGLIEKKNKTLCYSIEALKFSSVFRAYDVLNFMSESTMLDRVANLLCTEADIYNPNALINVEDELYIGASLGCPIGIMRHPLGNKDPWTRMDLTSRYNRIDEVVRAVRWYRIAPAFGIGESSIKISDETLEDNWHFESDQTWWCDIIGKKIKQIAPAVISRGMNLPKVECDGLKPFVVASKNPNGAISIATLPRTIANNKEKILPHANVMVDIGISNGPIGIFGEYRLLILKHDGILKGRRIWAQDLAGDDAIDITNRVKYLDKYIIIEGNIIKEVGLMAATKEDKSYPGVVLQIF